MEDGVIDGDLGVKDPGLARDRTELAWHRSGLAVVVALAVLLRHLWPLNGAKSALVLGIIAFAAIAWAVGLRGVQRSRPEANSVAALDAGHLRIFTLATLILAVAGFLLAFLFPG